MKLLEYFYLPSTTQVGIHFLLMRIRILSDKRYHINSLPKLISS